MTLNPEIFKAYDIRGLYPGEINEAIARQIGRGFVAYLKPATIAVSRDMRVSSRSLVWQRDPAGGPTRSCRGCRRCRRRR